VGHRGDLVDPPLFAPIRFHLNAAPPRLPVYFDHFCLCECVSKSADGLFQHCLSPGYFVDRAGCLPHKVALSSFDIGNVELVSEQDFGFKPISGGGVHSGSSFAFARTAGDKLVLNSQQVGLGPAKFVLPGPYQPGRILLGLFPQSQNRF